MKNNKFQNLPFQMKKSTIPKSKNLKFKNQNKIFTQTKNKIKDLFFVQ